MIANKYMVFLLLIIIIPVAGLIAYYPSPAERFNIIEYRKPPYEPGAIVKLKINDAKGQILYGWCPDQNSCYYNIRVVVIVDGVPIPKTVYNMREFEFEVTNE